MNDNNPPTDWSDRLVGFGAGLASALLFAASTRGTGLAMALAYVCILPLLIGAIGFSALASLAGAGAGALFLAYAGEPLLGIAFFLGFGVPGFLLGLLAGWTYRLQTPDDASGSSTKLLAYHLSPGVLLAGAVLVSACAAWTLTGALIWSEGGFHAALDAALAEYGPALDPTLQKLAKVAPDLDLAQAKKIIVLSFPGAVAASQTLLLTFNLWLAARAIDISGRLDRPWPPLPEMTVLPRGLGLAFLLAVGLCFAGESVAVFAGAFAASAGVALALQGLAAAHALTRGHSQRGAILASVYAVTLVGVAVAPPLLIALVACGLAESALSLRARKAARAKIAKIEETGE
ncbi:hypothetical protein GJ654_07800 [Rhodoblastus acidophilus]|uniref:DUF2232 domain-containing protein n=1 Tax=Rhodoblastus acidophilus TaxID=1074 RepID=A0A6N8DMX6_RHOAC|nr:hypothetical protein [Rhodoblastus acidophilus]MCW2273962.1 hypothetical protein [Rhodoblastus acidophilus]MTV30895.1 hypothetical protein [Rhodoblastus acidophilus]